MKRLLKYLVIVSIMMVHFLHGQAEDFEKVGTTAAQFLKTDVGARAIAMGGSFAAIANDVSALFWNPAGIAQIDNYQASFTKTNWIADISHGFAGLIIPLKGHSASGLSVTYQSMGEIEQTTIEEPKGTGLFFTAQDLSVGISYGKAMTDFLMVGITGKFIYQKIWNESALGFGVDIGMLLETGIKRTKIAMVMTNFGTDMQLDGRDLIRGYDQMPESAMNPHTEAKLSTEPWPLPTNFRLSIATDLLQSSFNRLSVIGAVMHPNDNPEHYNIGAEYSISERFFGRIGYRGNTDEEGLTLGGGIQFPLVGGTILTVDYAYADFGVFKSTQHLALGLKF